MKSRTLIGESALPRHEAERLISLVTGTQLSIGINGVDLGPDDVADFRGFVARRAAGEPLQYIEGSAAFGRIEVAVDPRVLIPRPETEQLWERALALLPVGASTLVDLGTGSGCIALAAKDRRPDVTVVGTDVSSDALAVARHNAAALALDVEFLKGDLFEALPVDMKSSVNVIVTNPPYVSADEWLGLPVEVRDHEPRQALVAEEDGVAFYRRLAASARRWLTPGGALIAEIGETQGPRILDLFDEAGWAVEIGQDLVGRDRFVTATP